MGSLFLIRHGQASYGEADYDRLSARGIDQAKQLGTHLATLGLDRIFVGPHVRQRQTYEYAAGTGKLVEGLPHDGLAEYPAFRMLQHFVPKLVEGDPRFAALNHAPTPKLLDEAFRAILGRWGDDSWQAPDVERVAEFVARVRGALDHAVTTSGPGARIGMITSAGPIGVAVGLAFGISPDRMVRTSVVVKNTSITELKFRREAFAWEPDQVTLVSFNGTPHLAADYVTDR